MSELVDRIGQLLSRLQSPDFFEREEAVRELGQCTEDEAVAGLVLAIEDADLGIRELAADLLTEMKSQVATQLLVRFLGHDDIGIRNLAAEILVRIGEDAVPILIDNITDDEPNIRKFVVDILGLIKDARAVEAVCARLGDENPNVICSAAEALGEIGAVGAVEALLTAAETVEDARLPAIEAVGKIGDVTVLSRLYAYSDTHDPMLLYVVLEAIGNIGDRSAIEHLSGFLDHADRTIAEAALMSIIEILSRNGDIADWELPLDRFTDFLFDGIRSKNRTITRFTLNRLPHWHGPDVIGGLIDAMGAVDEEDVDTIAAVLKEIGPSASPVILDKFKQATTPVKMALLDILKTVIDAEVTHRLLTFFDDPDPEIRRKIAHVIGMSGHAFCIPALRKLAADPVGHVRSAAFGALGWLATESDIDFLCAGLDDRYPDVREAAVGALILVGGTKVIDRFRADLEHRSVERQRLAVLGLGLIGDREVVPSLLKAVNHQEAAIRKSAINSLVRIGQVEDVGPLLLALNDENGGVRKAAISAAVSLLGERAIQEIRALLEDEDVWVRYLAINGIGEVGKHEYGGYIMPYLHDEQDIIKIAAVKALAQMGYQKAVPELKRLREQKNRDVADAAEAALTTIGGIT